MKKSQINVILAAGVVALLLFSGCAIGKINSSQSTTTYSTQQKNTQTNNDAVITCSVGGIPHSQTISYESGTYLKQLFSELVTANAQDPSSSETQHLQQKILQYTEQQGLLPAGMSADMILTQFEKRRQSFATQIIAADPVSGQGTSQQFFCNFVSTGQGSAFPIIILPRFIPIIMSPIPRLFVGWKTPLGVTSCGGLRSGTGFIATGQQQGVALGFWGIGFSIFLPPVMAYGMFGYALYAKVTAEEMEYWPPNNPPEITQTDPADGQQFVPVTTAELRFEINDMDNDLMSYNVTTEPNIGSASGGLKPGGTYSIPISGLEDLTEYTWHVEVTDGKDTTGKTMTFTTEAVAPILSNPSPADGERDVPMDLPHLQFSLKDYQGDTMEYTVQTSPNIGSAHVTGVDDGTYTVPVSGMTYGATYRWYVNVTDGTHWTRKILSFETGYPSQFNPFDYGWQYRKQVTIDHTQVLEDLVNFSVLVSTSDADLMKAQADGGDILFMNDIGVSTRIYHDIESYDVSPGTLITWVNIPSLSSSTDTVFYMYYGNPSCINQAYPKKTWDPGYEAVLHMNDATLSTISDSTSNEYIGTKKAVNEPIATNAQIYDGQTFDGSDDFIQFDTTIIPTGPKTISLWFKSTITSSDSFMAVLGNALNGGSQDKGFCISAQWKNGAVINFEIGNVELYNHFLTVEIPIPDNNLHYYTAVYDGTDLKVYRDGSYVALDNTKDGTEANPDYNFAMGRSYISGGRYYFHGTLDEIRILNGARSSAWISTEYANHNNPFGFLSFGPEEPHP